MRSRPAQRGDRAALAALVRKGRAWEPGPADARLFEIGGRIVACEQHAVVRVRPPAYGPEPIAALDAAWLPGEELALVGAGLCMEARLAHAAQIHRLARTLAAQELGARWVIVTATIPTFPPFDAAGVVQQVVAGAIEHEPISVPLRDGYWPIGTLSDERVVLVRRNDEF